MSKATDTRNDDTRRDDERHDGTESPERLEREVDQARARLGRTASELSDRLSPGELIDQALGMAREHGGELGRNLGAQVKNNPLPMILTSVGISWMMMSSGNKRAVHADDSYATGKDTNGLGFKDAIGESVTKSRDKAAAVGDRLQGATADVKDSVQDATADVKDSAQHARQSLVKFYRDQPLLAGSLGIAIGAALGALVPPTEMEDGIFGDASDRSVDAAKASAVEKYDEVRESVRAE